MSQGYRVLKNTTSHVLISCPVWQSCQSIEKAELFVLCSQIYCQEWKISLSRAGKCLRELIWAIQMMSVDQAVAIATKWAGGGAAIVGCGLYSK